MNGIIRQLNFVIEKSIMRPISVKATTYNEGYSTKKEPQGKIVHSGGFKRDHDDSEIRLKVNKKKNPYDCENEKWFPEQLNSGETYRTNIVHEDGHGKNMFHPKYGNSFWDPHNYN